MNSTLYMHQIKSIELGEIEKKTLVESKKEGYFTRTFTITGEDSEFVIHLFSHDTEATLKLEGEVGNE